MGLQDIAIKERLFASYRYSAFISYATSDDQFWNYWVSCFTDELNRSLRAAGRGVKVPPAHLSGDNPLVNGRLSGHLEKNIEDSFAMFVFVHDNYLESPWCLKELEYFRSLFGPEGFEERLYVIAMSEDAINALTQTDDWRRVCPNDDQLWLQFFYDHKRSEPIEIYTDNQLRRIVSNAFWQRFVAVRKDLLEKMGQAIDRERRSTSYPSTAAVVEATPEDQHLVRIYIEGTREQERYWESLGQQVEQCWSRVIETMALVPPLYLRPTGLPMNEIDQRPMLDDADGVVLLWGRKTPDSLAAQIKKVEPKLSGPFYAPGLIAYIMERSEDLPGSRMVGFWNVARFKAEADGSARVLPEDAPILEAFLTSVIERKRRRAQALQQTRPAA